MNFPLHDKGQIVCYMKTCLVLLLASVVTREICCDMWEGGTTVRKTLEPGQEMYEMF
jgi:hypothetical protein